MFREYYNDVVTIETLFEFPERTGYTLDENSYLIPESIDEDTIIVVTYTRDE